MDSGAEIRRGEGGGDDFLSEPVEFNYSFIFFARERV